MLYLFASSLLSLYLPLLSFFVLSVLDLFAYTHGKIHLNFVVAYEVSDCLSHIVDLGHLYKEWDVLVQNLVRHVVVPTLDWQTTLRLQHIGRGGVVNNYCIFHITAQLTHILHKDSVKVGAVFTEKSLGAISLGVHHVHERISILK